MITECCLWPKATAASLAETLQTEEAYTNRRGPEFVDVRTVDQEVEGLHHRCR
jgi:hypothetical protein